MFNLFNLFKRPAATPPANKSDDTVVLREERHGGDRRWLSATRSSDGGLYIHGHDSGPGTEFISSTGTYSWTYKYSPDKIPGLLEVLGANPGEDILGVLRRCYRQENCALLEEKLRECGIERSFHNSDSDE